MKTFVTSIAVLAFATVASAAPIYYDNFNDRTVGDNLSAIGDGWTNVNTPAVEISASGVAGTNGLELEGSGAFFGNAKRSVTTISGSLVEYSAMIFLPAGGKTWMDLGDTTGGVPLFVGEWQFDKFVDHADGNEVSVGFGSLGWFQGMIRYQQMGGAGSMTVHYRDVTDATGVPIGHYTEILTVTGSDLDWDVGSILVGINNSQAGANEGLMDELLLEYPIPQPPATDFTWVADDVGNWANSISWSFAGPLTQGIANNPNHIAIFGDAVSTNTTVVTNAQVTVNRVQFDNVAHSYNIAGHGSVNLAATTTSPGTDPTVSVQGTHQFQAIVRLHNNAVVNVDTGSALSFINLLDLNGNTLTKSGGGTISIRSDFTTGGGTLNITEGTVSGNGTVGGSAVNSGGVISPGNSAAAAGGQVPEPGSLLLLVLGGLLTCWAWGWRS